MIAAKYYPIINLAGKNLPLNFTKSNIDNFFKLKHLLIKERMSRGEDPQNMGDFVDPAEIVKRLSNVEVRFSCLMQASGEFEGVIGTL